MHTPIKFSFLATCLMFTACSAEDPSFLARSGGLYQVDVTESALDPQSTVGTSYSMEDVDDDSETGDGDTEMSAILTDDESGNEMKGKKSGQSADGSASKNSASNDDSSDADASKGSQNAGKKANDDSTQQSKGKSDDTGGSNQGGGSADSAKVAKACAPMFRGTARQIRVVDPTDSAAALAISPDTVIAMHLRGNQDSLVLNLGASSGMAGLCLILTGHQSSVIISSASSIGKLVYIGRGNESTGSITMSAGSSIAQTMIELTGNHPKLQLNGVDASACAGAKLKGSQPTLQCQP